MSTKTTPTTAHKPSTLESFHLTFEYDMSWQEAKQSIRQRTKHE